MLLNICGIAKTALLIFGLSIHMLSPFRALLTIILRLCRHVRGAQGIRSVYHVSNIGCTVADNK